MIVKNPYTIKTETCNRAKLSHLTTKNDHTQGASTCLPLPYLYENLATDPADDMLVTSRLKESQHADRNDWTRPNGREYGSPIE